MLLYQSEGRLHVRPVDRIEAEPIAGSEAAENPFFPPDGQWIGFTRNGAVWKMLVGGGPGHQDCGRVDHLRRQLG